jgi:hypothetical protein
MFPAGYLLTPRWFHKVFTTVINLNMFLTLLIFFFLGQRILHQVCTYVYSTFPVCLSVDVVD